MQPDTGAWQTYADLTTPIAVTAPNQHILYLNRAAERFWGISAADLAGQPVWIALHISPTDGADLTTWLTDVVMPALTTGDPVPCRTEAGDGSPRQTTLSGTRVQGDDQWHIVLTVGADQGARAHGAIPEWALRDPLTGLYNRHQWAAQHGVWDTAEGAVLFFDLEGLKSINDLYGHHAGDLALAFTGQALTAEAPDGALVLRFGGDEFLALLAAPAAGQAEAFAQRVIGRAAARAEEAGLPLPLQLDYGFAALRPGHLDEAVREADEDLYTRRGMLLRGTRGGCLVLTRAARGRVLTPVAAESAAVPGAFAQSFGPEFEAFLRQAYRRSLEQAREFVAFVAPDRGCVGVEVGAGSGRITFDGGLAERIGEGGQLLVTDASAAQVAAARKRAREAGLHWLRFLQAPVEDLPVASATADLVLGVAFLQFTDPAAAMRSMARVVRPGGRVALSQGLAIDWGPAWAEALVPVRAELARYGLPWHEIFLPQADLEARFAAANLALDNLRVSAPEAFVFPSPEVAVGFTRQNQMIPLLLRGVPPERQRAVTEAFERRLREASARLGPAGTAFSMPLISISAHRAHAGGAHGEGW